mmetsp:Transcript_36277/g.112260  ORF Transcript_36277/g.112260 Transcript_36277/m.112260 type:complete len:229 (-) Transcript_36277:128-814(-)
MAGLDPRGLLTGRRRAAVGARASPRDPTGRGLRPARHRGGRGGLGSARGRGGRRRHDGFHRGVRRVLHGRGRGRRLAGAGQRGDVARVHDGAQARVRDARRRRDNGRLQPPLRRRVVGGRRVQRRLPRPAALRLHRSRARGPVPGPRRGRDERRRHLSARQRGRALPRQRRGEATALTRSQRPVPAGNTPRAPRRHLRRRGARLPGARGPRRDAARVRRDGRRRREES